MCPLSVLCAMYLSLDLLYRECFWKDKKGMTGKEIKKNKRNKGKTETN